MQGRAFYAGSTRWRAGSAGSRGRSRAPATSAARRRSSSAGERFL